MLEVTRETALRLFTALGFSTAGKWDNTRLQKKLRTLHNLIEEDVTTEDDKLDELLDEILEVGSKVQLTGLKKDEGTPESTTPKKKKKKVAAEADSGAEPAEKPAAKGKKKKKAKAEKAGKKEAAAPKKKVKKEKAAKQEKTTRAPKAGGIIAEIVICLTKKAMTREELEKHMAQKFPDRPVKGMRHTINVQVPGRLTKDKGLKFSKDDKGKFKIV